jgi:hypothetical protein
MYLMKHMTDASVRESGQYLGDEYPSNVERSIAKLDGQRCKKDLLDLVIREAFIPERTLGSHTARSTYRAAVS